MLFFFEKYIVPSVNPKLISSFEQSHLLDQTLALEHKSNISNGESTATSGKNIIIKNKSADQIDQLKIDKDASLLLKEYGKATVSKDTVPTKDDNDNYLCKSRLVNRIQTLPDVEASLFARKSISYSPYVEFAATRFFNRGDNSGATGIDIFLPFWIYTEHHLPFAHLRIYDRSGPALEGNAHFGYRYLSSERDYLYGIYVAYDRKRSSNNNIFDQLTFGAEAWFQKLFIGVNTYYPLNDDPVMVTNTTNKYVFDWKQETVWLNQSKGYEKPVGGADVTVGYEVLNGLIAYVGGYYFGSHEINTIYGPKAKLTYDWHPKTDKKVLGLFDKLGLEIGAQRDNFRGTVWYLSANFRLGLPNRANNLNGVARHMTDLVRRDVDIISESFIRSTSGFFSKLIALGSYSGMDLSGGLSAMDGMSGITISSLIDPRIIVSNIINYDYSSSNIGIRLPDTGLFIYMATDQASDYGIISKEASRTIQDLRRFPDIPRALYSRD